MLSSFWGHSEPLLRRNALEVHVRRLYRMYAIRNLKVSDGPPIDFMVARWLFSALDSANDAEGGAGQPSSALRAQPRLRDTRSGGSSVSHGSASLVPGSERPPSSLSGMGMGMRWPSAVPKFTGNLSIAESYNDLAALAAAGGSGSGHTSQAAAIGKAMPGKSSGSVGPSPLSSMAQAAATAASRAGIGAPPAAYIMRHGALAVFTNLAHLRQRFKLLLALLAAGPNVPAVPGLEDDDSMLSDADEAAPSPNDATAPCVHVLHIALLQSPLGDPNALTALGLQSASNSSSVGTGAAPGSASRGGTGAAAAPAGSPPPQSVQTIRDRLASNATSGVVNVADSVADGEALERAVVDYITRELVPYQRRMRASGIRRITFMVPNPKESTSRTSHTPLRDRAIAFVAAVTQSGFAIQRTKSASMTAAPAAAAPSAQASPDVSRPPVEVGGGGGMVMPPAVAAAVAAAEAGTSANNIGAPGWPYLYTFRASLNYSEDSIVRHIEPPSSAHLELTRLSNFKIRLVPTPNRVVHVYAAEPQTPAGAAGKAGGAGAAAAAGAGAGEGGGRGQSRMRFFVRAIVRQTARIPTLDSVYEQYPGPERMFVECLDALSVAMGDALQDTNLPVGNNHIFLNVLPVANVRPEYVEQVTKILARRYADRLRRLRVSQVEFKIHVNVPP